MFKQHWRFRIPSEKEKSTHTDNQSNSSFLTHHMRNLLSRLDEGVSLGLE